MIETERFDSGQPHPGTNDTIDIEWVDSSKTLAGLMRVCVRPDESTTWFMAVVHELGCDPVVILDWELPLVTNAFEFRAPGIWTDLVCETPIEQWTVGLEAFGVAVDPTQTLTPDSYGDRTPVGLDLDVEAATAPEEHDGGFEHEVTVAGEVLLGSKSWEIDARGVRRRWWQPPGVPLAIVPSGFAVETRVAVQWPHAVSPEVRGWVGGSRPGWVELPFG